jgi:hypothetical protein
MALGKFPKKIFLDSKVVQSRRTTNGSASGNFAVDLGEWIENQVDEGFINIGSGSGGTGTTLTSGVVAGSSIVLTSSDASVVTVNASSLLNSELVSASFAPTTSVLTMTKDDASVVNVTLPTMTGATALLAGLSGLVPLPSAGDEDKYLKGDGTWGASSSANITEGTLTAATANRGVDLGGNNLTISNVVTGLNTASLENTISATDGTSTTLFSAFPTYNELRATSASNNSIIRAKTNGDVISYSSTGKYQLGTNVFSIPTSVGLGVVGLNGLVYDPVTYEIKVSQSHTLFIDSSGFADPTSPTDAEMHSALVLIDAAVGGGINRLLYITGTTTLTDPILKIYYVDSSKTITLIKDNVIQPTSYTRTFTVGDWLAGPPDRLITDDAIHGLGIGYKQVTVYDAGNVEVIIETGVDPTTGAVTLYTTGATFAGTIFISK